MTQGTDAFDVIWIDEDPLGRDITLYQTVVDKRVKAAKHQDDEFLPHEEIREIIVDPDRIDLTGKNPRHTEIYYKKDTDQPHPYGRVVVDFDGDKGSPISWSRYEKHVSFMEVVYEKPGIES